MKRLFLAALAIVAGLSAGCGKSQDLGDAQTRTIYLVAREQAWDYVEGGVPAEFPDKLTNQADILASIPTYTGRSTYTKYLFSLANKDFEVNSDWTVEKRKTAELGILGPVIRAQEGDTIELHVKKDDSIPAFRIAVPPGLDETEFTEDGNITIYKWKVSSIPLENNQDGLDPENNPAKALIYRAKLKDSVSDVTMENAGLIGPVVIYAKGLLSTGSRPSPRGIDKEHFALFKMFNENETPPGLLAANAPAGPLADIDSQKSNLRYSVNGRQFGSGPKIAINRKDRTVWYALGGSYTGSDADPVALPADPFGWSYDPTWASDLGYLLTLHPSTSVSHVVPRVADVGDSVLFAALDDFLTRGMFTIYEVKDN